MFTRSLLAFRQFTAKEIVSALKYESFYNSIDALNRTISTYRNTNYTMDDFRMENKDTRNLRYHFMFDAANIAGFCKTETTRNNRVYLYSYLIQPEYRGRSIDASSDMNYNDVFMNCICNVLREEHTTLELKVHEDNSKAYNGYVRNHFRTTGKQEKRYMMERPLA